MSDTTLTDLPIRVVILEQIAKDTRDGIADMRIEMRQGFAELRTEMRGGFADVRGEMRGGLADLRGEVGSLRDRTDVGLEGVRRDLRTTFPWLVTAMISVFVALMGVMAQGFYWL